MASILIVDDEDAIRDLLAGLLATDGYAITTADSGLSALTEAERAPPDLVITDMIMPDLDGIGIIPLLRALKPCPRILAISGGARHGEIDVLTAAENLGADAALEKPLDLMELRAVVARLVALARS